MLFSGAHGQGQKIGYPLFKEHAGKLEKKLVNTYGSSMNPYEILEISPGASSDEIKAAYHRLAKKWHPDRFTGAEKEEAERRFRQLAESFNMLKDSGRREEMSKPLLAQQPAQITVVPATPSTQEVSPVTIPLRDRNASDWYEEARQAFEEADYERALGLIRYCLKMDTDRAEHHVLLAKVVDAMGGDRKTLVKALEAAVRLNPKDVDSTIRLAEVFQELGMYARSTRMWETARKLVPNHKLFNPGKKESVSKPIDQVPGIAKQYADLKEQGVALFNRIFRRG